MKALPKLSPRAEFLVLLAMLIIAAGLRAYGMGWDGGYHFHPDERAIVERVQRLRLPDDGNLSVLLNPQVSPLNPQWFNYGSFPLYLIRVTAWAGARFDPWHETYDGYYQVGRTLSVAFDLVTIVLVWLLGRRIGGSYTGLLGAAFTTFAVIHIQLSHFLTVDVALTTLIVASVYFAVRFADSGRTSDAIWSGVFLGFGLATKVSIAPLFLAVIVAAWVYWQRGPHAGGESTETERFSRVVPAVLYSGIAAGICFFLGEPYAFLDRDLFLRHVTEQSEMVRRTVDLPYTRQYIDTPAFLYHIQQLAVWGLGLPLGVLAWVGGAFSIFAAWRWRDRRYLILLAWWIPYFLLTGSFAVKFLRYLLPMTPFLFVGAADLLVWLAGRRVPEREAPERKAERGSTPDVPVESTGVLPANAGQDASVADTTEDSFLPQSWSTSAGTSGASRQTTAGRAGGAIAAARQHALLPGDPEPAQPAFGWAWPVSAGVAAFVLLFSAAYALAYDRIYAEPHPAVQMSAWINANVPPDATIAKEHWEEAVPNLGTRRLEELRLYDSDLDPGKLDHMIDVLRRSEYIVFYSQRLYHTISRLPERYPMTSRYYRALFDGSLGYELVAETRSDPNIGGVRIVDDTFSRAGLPVPEGYSYGDGLVWHWGFADESFTVYDHPTVMLFRRNGPLDEARVRELLSINRAGSDLGLGLMLSPEEWEAQRAGGTWSEIFSRSVPANQYPFFAWLLTIGLVSLFTMPIGLWLFRSLPDRGYLLARAFGILLFAFVPWLLASLHLMPFTRLTILITMAVLAVISGVIYWRNEASFGEFFRTRWKLVAVCEVLFLAAFITFYAIRLLNPDLWHPARGGEKPMDFAYLNAVIRSTYFPPYDPWFAGGYMNYYYFGFVIVGVLIKVSGIIPWYAYNLAVPLLFALSIGAVFSVVYNLTSLAARLAGERCSEWGKLGAGLGGALLFGVAGNIDGAKQLYERLTTLGGPGIPSGIPGITGLTSALSGLGAVLFGGQQLPPFDFWRSSRMMTEQISITEFPYFTFLFADLHAHLIALPFTVLAIGLALALLVGTEEDAQRPRFGALSGIFRGTLAPAPIAVLIALAFTVGALRITNSWDYPTFLLIGLAAAAIGELRHLNGSVRTILLRLAGAVVLLWAFSTLPFLPFHDRFELFYAGVHPAEERTPLSQYLNIHLMFVFLIGSYLVSEALRVYRESSHFRAARLGVARWDEIPRIQAMLSRIAGSEPGRANAGVALTAGILVLAILLYALGYQTVGFLVVALAAVASIAVPLLRQGADAPVRLFVLMLAAVGMALGIGVDLVTLDGDIQRMNTVFKFYLQAWTLFSIAAAFGGWVVIRRMDAWLEQHRDARYRAGQWGVTLWSIALAALVVAVALYPWFATPVRIQDRFVQLPPTFDGSAYMRAATYQEERGPIPLGQDYLAIRWLQENVVGTPVVVEAAAGPPPHMPLYRWAGRVSVNTGLPTIIGWDWHQTQQRWGYRAEIDERLRDVYTIYTSPSLAIAETLLKKYDATYVYVGPVERQYYGEAGLSKFDRAVGFSFDLVYDDEGVKIYRLRSL